METIYTIPVKEAFAESDGCPFCTMLERLEDNELDLILGASMMEPDVRIKTNREGFCLDHYQKMLWRKNRLGMALTLESHLDELRGEIENKPLAPAGARAQKRLSALLGSCYVCGRIDFHFSHMVEAAVMMWEKDEDFRRTFSGAKFFCLPHYKALLGVGAKRMNKKAYAPFATACAAVVEPYFDELRADIKHFCRKFDYRFADEPWGNAKDAPARAARFLRGTPGLEPGKTVKNLPVKNVAPDEE